MRRLITERDVRSLPRGSVLEVAADTLVTAAAADALLLRGVELRRGALAGACPPRLAPSGPVLPPLPDGDYLLEVRGGSARVRRIDPAS